LALYSITYLGIWYRGEPLTLPELITTCQTFRVTMASKSTGKRPQAIRRLAARRCKELRSIADGEGIEILAVAANNDFSCPAGEVREAQIAYVRELIRMTADMGAEHLRVFLAWWGVTLHPQLATYEIMENLWPVVHARFSPEEIWTWCRDALIECARYAGTRA
jgi:sugar phosphate isomerase/epimerase